MPGYSCINKRVRLGLPKLSGDSDCTSPVEHFVDKVYMLLEHSTIAGWLYHKNVEISWMIIFTEEPFVCTNVVSAWISYTLCVPLNISTGIIQYVVSGHGCASWQYCRCSSGALGNSAKSRHDHTWPRQEEAQPPVHQSACNCPLLWQLCNCCHLYLLVGFPQ